MGSQIKQSNYQKRNQIWTQAVADRKARTRSRQKEQARAHDDVAAPQRQLALRAGLAPIKLLFCSHIYRCPFLSFCSLCGGSSNIGRAESSSDRYRHASRPPDVVGSTGVP